MTPQATRSDTNPLCDWGKLARSVKRRWLAPNIETKMFWRLPIPWPGYVWLVWVIPVIQYGPPTPEHRELRLKNRFSLDSPCVDPVPSEPKWQNEPPLSVAIAKTKLVVRDKLSINLNLDINWVDRWALVANVEGQVDRD